MEEGHVRIQTEIEVVVQVLKESFLAFPVDNKTESGISVEAILSSSDGVSKTAPAIVLQSRLICGWLEEK
jgi:hypothetical protein